MLEVKVYPSSTSYDAENVPSDLLERGIYHRIESFLEAIEKAIYVFRNSNQTEIKFENVNDHTIEVKMVKKRRRIRWPC